MTGLRESFDVAKRLALFQYVVKTQEGGCYYHDMLHQYRDDHDMLKSCLKNYRKDCVSERAVRKFQTGLVRQDSKTSLSKYVRIAFEFGLLDFNYDSSIPKGGSIHPNHISRVVTSILSIEENENNSFIDFEISEPMKCLIFALLLRKDYAFLIPLIFSIGRHSDTLTVDNVRRKLLKPFAENLIKSINISSRMSKLPIDTSLALYNRLNVVNEYLRKLNRGKAPHGLLHLLDPRLHWIYDLKLVDYEKLCSQGNLKLADFWKLENKTLEDFVIGVIENSDSILTNYSMMISKSGTKRESIEIVNKSLNMLSEYYTNLIPLDAIVLLVFAISAGRGNPVWKNQVIQRIQDEGHSLYREYDGSLGFVKIK